LTADIGGGGWAGEDVVPFEDVGFGGVRDDVRGWVGLDSLVFAGQLRYVSDISELGIEGQHTRLLAARAAMACTLINPLDIVKSRCTQYYNLQIQPYQ